MVTKNERMNVMKFDVIISSKRKWFDFNFKELFRYRDLIFMFVKRTFVSQYKQTVLGPIWAIVQPLLTTIVFTIIFGGIAQLPTDGIPSFIFYLCGNIVWTFFSTSLISISNTFISNAPILGKVYFPRLVMPISTVLSQIISFLIQFIFLLIVLLYSYINGTLSININFSVFLIPILLIQMTLLSLGCGIIISSLTTKYRDLAILVTFGVQLWMYATPVVYPASQIDGTLKTLMMLNPVSPIIEFFRYAFLGSGSIPWNFLGISIATTVVVLFIGVILFSRVEKTFMDTV